MYRRRAMIVSRGTYYSLVYVIPGIILLRRIRQNGLFLAIPWRVIEICCKTKTSKHNHHHQQQRHVSAATGAQLVMVVVAVLDLRTVVCALWYLLPGTWYAVEYDTSRRPKRGWTIQSTALLQYSYVEQPRIAVAMATSTAHVRVVLQYASLRRKKTVPGLPA